MKIFKSPAHLYIYIDYIYIYPSTSPQTKALTFLQLTHATGRETHHAWNVCVHIQLMSAILELMKDLKIFTVHLGWACIGPYFSLHVEISSHLSDLHVPNWMEEISKAPQLLRAGIWYINKGSVHQNKPAEECAAFSTSLVASTWFCSWARLKWGKEMQLGVHPS